MSNNPDRDTVLDNVMMVSPNLGVWRGNYMLPQSKVVIQYSGQDLDQDSITSPQTRLINDKWPLDSSNTPWIKRFRDIKQAQVRLLNKYSVCSGITGVRIIPKSAGVEFFPQLIGPTVGELKEELTRPDITDSAKASIEQRLRVAQEKSSQFVDETPVYNPARDSDEQSVAYQLHLLAEEFCDQMPDVFEQIQRNEKEEVWAAVKDRLPKTREEMRSKFYCGTIPIEFATGGEADRVKVTHRELQRYQSVVTASVRTAVDEAIENMIAQPRAELAKAINSMTELISRDGRVTERTFAPVRRAIDKLRMFSFVATDDMMQEIKKLETMMDRQVPRDLTSANANSSGFMRAAQVVMDELENSMKMEEHFRKFGNRRMVSL